MKIAVISDIHGNLEAFNEVLGDIEKQHVEETVCLGDIIGYGPEPEAVVQWIRDRKIRCVLGNHELAVLRPEYLEKMNPSARQSALLTQTLISSETMEYAISLPAFIIFHGARCVHGCPPDSPTTYLFQVSNSRLREIFQGMKETVCFAGHTHDLKIISYSGKEIERTALGQETVTLKQDRQYIINVGSVGQPRDGTNHAKYVIWDPEANTVQVRFVPYRIAVTAQKILELGFPEYNAQRLW